MLAEAYSRVTAAVAELAEPDLSTGTRCRGWTVADVVYHLLLDAERALVALATPTDRPPDADAASYWAMHKPGSPWAADHERFVRLCTAAHSGYRQVIDRWAQTSAAAVRAARLAPASGRVATQGHVLSVADFASTLVVEAVFHHLDLTVNLPAAAPPAPAPLELTRTVLDRILGRQAPPEWPSTDYILVAGGRLPLPADRRAALGPHADRFPLLG